MFFIKFAFNGESICFDFASDFIFYYTVNVIVAQRARHSECTVRVLVWEILLFRAVEVYIWINGYTECTVHIPEHRARSFGKVLFLYVLDVFSAPSISTDGTWLP